jgi:hypothetical protein
MVCTFYLGQQFNPLFVKKDLHALAFHMVQAAYYPDWQVCVGIVAWRVECQSLGQHLAGTA